ncbi:MAG: hypothetical protein IIV97_05620, partial [Oscillospiraceae bacterium]|nr:hypothetical protein [Oscillospiraceae bacterium]
MKRDIILTSEETNTLLKFLYSSLSSMPKGKVKSFLEHRQVSVNSSVTTKFDYPIKPNDVVKISMSEGTVKTHGIEIIYEDDYLIAV